MDTHSWIGPQFNGLWSVNANWVDTTPGTNFMKNLAPGQPGETNIVVQFQGSVVSYVDNALYTANPNFAVDEVIFSSNGNRIIQDGNNPNPLHITNNLLTSILDTSGSSAFDCPVTLSAGNINVVIPPATGAVSFNNTVTSLGASSTLVETAGSAGTLQIGSDAGIPVPPGTSAAVNGAVNNNVNITIQSGELLLNTAVQTDTAVGTGLITLGTGAGGSTPTAVLQFGNDLQMNPGSNVLVNNDGQIFFSDNFEEELGNMTLNGNSAFATVNLQGNQLSNDRQVSVGYIPILAVSNSVTATSGATIVPGQIQANPFGYLDILGNPVTFTVTDTTVNNQNVPGLTVTAKIVNELFAFFLPNDPGSQIVVTAPMNKTGTMVTTASNTYDPGSSPPFIGFLVAQNVTNNETIIDTGATLQVDNAILFHTIPLDMQDIELNGGELTGTGYVGNLTATTTPGSTVSPGDNGGVGQIATLHVGVFASVANGDNPIVANVDFSGTTGVVSVNYLVDFTGSNPGQYDQLLVNGSVNLGPVILNGSNQIVSGGTNVVVSPTPNIPINVTVPIIQAAPGAASGPTGSFFQGILPFFDPLTVGGQQFDEKFSVAVNAVDTGSFTGNNATVARISANTTTTLTSSSPQVAGVPTSPVGTPVTFTATVAPESTPNNLPILGAPPTGSIVFNIDGVNQAPVNLVNGSASFTFTFTTVAMHTVAAQYIPTPPLATDPFVGSVGNLPIQNVVKVPAVITYNPTANPQNFGSPLSFTITISTGTPTPVLGVNGTMVTYQIDGGAMQMTPIVANGTTASIPLNGLSIGNHTIAVSYPGDANLLANSMSFTQTIVAAADSVTVASSQNPAPFGTSVTFTATVSSAIGPPVGAFAFVIDGTMVATGIPTVNGVATFTTSTLTGAGSPHSVTALFTDTDGLFVNNSASLAGGQTMTQTTPPPVSVTAPSTTQFGQPATLTATFTTNLPATPTGTVAFYAGSTLLGTATLTVNGGVATASLVTSILPAGINAITVVYSGDANFKSSTTTGAATITTNSNPVAVGAGEGFEPLVQVFDTGTQTVRLQFLAFPSVFLGGVRVTTADLNGDGVPDIICAAGPGGGPEVAVFNGATGQPLSLPGLGANFYAFAPFFNGGLYVAVGDLNGDGVQDIIVGADSGGGPEVRAFNTQTGALIRDFFAFTPTFNGGVRVAAGDLNGTGYDDIIAGAGPGGGPEVRAFDGRSNAVIRDLFAFPLAFNGGVYVAAGDVTGIGRAELIVGAGAGGGPQVLVFDTPSPPALESFYAFPPSFAGGVRVGTVALFQGGRDAILTGAGPGALPQVNVIDASTLSLLDSFYALDKVFAGGVYAGV